MLQHLLGARGIDSDFILEKSPKSLKGDRVLEDEDRLGIRGYPALVALSCLAGYAGRQTHIARGGVDPDGHCCDSAP